jgi:arylsulfatase A-like enzyme
MKKNKNLLQTALGLSLAAGIATSPQALAAASEAPINVIMILSDDLGWADVSYDGRSDFYETPHFDALAARGVSFHRAYSASPLCSPTRASIMLGQNPARIGLTAPRAHIDLSTEPTMVPRTRPNEKSIGTLSAGVFPNNLPTLARLINEAGYATGHFGKWHLGRPPFSPLQNGFDVDIPHHAGPGPAGNFVAPWNFSHIQANYPNEHIEDRMAAEAVAWIEQQVAAGKPFYMHYWQFSVHAPFDAKADLIEKYRHKANSDHSKSPTYAAMVQSMDDSIGTLVAALERLGIADNTAIIFSSDNGGNRYNGIIETDIHGNEYTVEPTDNAPLRGGKATQWEGGIRVPTAIYWPGVTPRGGAVSDAIIQSTDFYPTILSLLNIPLPPDHPVDGEDFSAVLRGQDWQRARGIITYFPHNPPVPDWLPPSISIIDGDWKLIRIFYYGDHPGEHQYKLFNLNEDIGEQANLAERYPERVRTMDQMMEDYIQEANVFIPQPNPNFNPAQFNPARIGVQPGGLKRAQTREERVARITGGAPAQEEMIELDGESELKGWQVGRDTVGLSLQDGNLRVVSTGRDPWFFYEFEPPLMQGGPFSIEFEILANEADLLRVFGRTGQGRAFRPEEAHRHNLAVANEWVSIAIPLNTLPPINAIRINPPGNRGETLMRNLQVKDANGRVIHQWFGD